MPKAAGFLDIITYDMGGTSTDVSLVKDGIAEYTTKRKVCGLPSGVPMIDVHAVGAGGGSIAHIDNAGALKVGPESAGANPGPVAYNLGNEQPVVTDANLVLGRINPHYVLGGRLKIDAQLSRAAMKKQIADPMGLSVEAAAQGVISVVNSNMARAIRVITVEKGHNPPISPWWPTAAPVPSTPSTWPRRWASTRCSSPPPRRSVRPGSVDGRHQKELCENRPHPLRPGDARAD